MCIFYEQTQLMQSGRSWIIEAKRDYHIKGILSKDVYLIFIMSCRLILLWLLEYVVLPHFICKLLIIIKMKIIVLAAFLISYVQSAWIPSDQFPVFTFNRDLWHPSFTKKYLDSDSFIIVNHERSGMDTYVELLQTTDTTPLTCNCQFTKASEEKQSPILRML